MHADKRPSSPIHAHPRHPRFFFPPSSSLLCLATLLLASAAHAAAIQPDGTHTIEIGLSRSGTAQADVLANGGIYEPILLLESEPEYKAEGESQTYTVSADIWAKHGDAQESIAATLTVHWVIVGAQQVTADKAHLDNAQTSKTEETTSQWVSTDLTLALPTRRGEEYMVAALVAVSEAKLQSAVPSLSESITVVGVEIGGADEPLDLQVGERVTLTAIAAPSGGDYTWTFSHGEDFYATEDIGNPNSKCIRLTRPVLDFVADVQYTKGTVTAPSLRWVSGDQYTAQSAGGDGGTFQSDAVAMSADGFTCALRNARTVCGIDESFSFIVEATTDDPEVLLEGVTVSVGNWTATDAGAASVSSDGLLPFYFQFTAPAEEITPGVHSVSLSANSDDVIVLSPEDEDSPVGDAKVAVIHAQIQGHDEPEWRAKGDHDAVTLEADVQGPSDGLCRWSLPEGVKLLGGVADGPGATSTITVSFTAPGSPTIGLSYKWPPSPEDLPPGAQPVSTEFDPTTVAAVREDWLGDWLPDDAAFYVMALGLIEEVSGQLDDLLDTEQCTLRVQETPTPVVSGGWIEWRIDGASGTFDPDYSSEDNQTEFTAGSIGGSATVTAKYTATLDGRTIYTESSKQCNIAGLIRTQIDLDYAVVDQTMDMAGRPTEISAETGLSGGSFQVSVHSGPGGAGEVSRRVEDDRTIFLISGSNPGPVKLKIAYMVVPEGSQYAVPAGESIVAFTVYEVKVDWTKEPRHDWVSEGDTVTLTARVFGDPGTGDDETPNKSFDPSTVHWEAFVHASRTASDDGETFALIQAHRWSVTASVRVQRQGSEDPPEEMASTQDTVRGVRLYVAHPESTMTIAKGAATTVSAAIENAPGPINGEFIWTCDSAEFYKDGSWVKKEVRLTEDTAQVRFGRPGYLIAVDLAYEADVPVAGEDDPVRIRIPARRLIDDVYYDDRTAFRVEGFAIAGVPEYGLSGHSIDVNGKPTRLQAVAYPTTSGTPPTWTVTGAGSGTAEHENTTYNPAIQEATWTARFTGGQSGNVTVSASGDLDGDGGSETATAQFPVYALRLDISRTPAHDWVAIGEQVDLTAALYGDPGTGDDVEFSPDTENICWGVGDGDSHVLDETGRSIPVTLDGDPWDVKVRLRVQEEDSDDPPETLVEASIALPTGVHLSIDERDEKECVYVGQTVTFTASLEGAPDGDPFEYVWECDQAEFQVDDEWVEGPHTTAEDTVVLRFVEYGDPLSVTLALEVTPAGSDPVTIAAKRLEGDEWVPDPALFQVAGIGEIGGMTSAAVATYDPEPYVPSFDVLYQLLVGTGGGGIASASASGQGSTVRSNAAAGPIGVEFLSIDGIWVPLKPEAGSDSKGYYFPVAIGPDKPNYIVFCMKGLPPSANPPLNLSSMEGSESGPCVRVDEELVTQLTQEWASRHPVFTADAIREALNKLSAGGGVLYCTPPITTTGRKVIRLKLYDLVPFRVVLGSVQDVNRESIPESYHPLLAHLIQLRVLGADAGVPVEWLAPWAGAKPTRPRVPEGLTWETAIKVLERQYADRLLDRPIVDDVRGPLAEFLGSVSSQNIERPVARKIVLEMIRFGAIRRAQLEIASCQAMIDDIDQRFIQGDQAATTGIAFMSTTAAPPSLFPPSVNAPNPGSLPNSVFSPRTNIPGKMPLAAHPLLQLALAATLGLEVGSWIGDAGYDSRAKAGQVRALLEEAIAKLKQRITDEEDPDSEVYLHYSYMIHKDSLLENGLIWINNSPPHATRDVYATGWQAKMKLAIKHVEPPDAVYFVVPKPGFGPTVGPQEVPEALDNHTPARRMPGGGTEYIFGNPAGSGGKGTVFGPVPIPAGTNPFEPPD